MASPLKLFGSKRAVGNNVASGPGPETLLVAAHGVAERQQGGGGFLGKFRTSIRKPLMNGEKEATCNSSNAMNKDKTASTKMDVTGSAESTIPTGQHHDVGTSKEKRGKRVRTIRKKVKKSTLAKRAEQDRLLAEKEAEIERMEARLAELVKARENQMNLCEKSSEGTNANGFSNQIGVVSPGNQMSLTTSEAFNESSSSQNDATVNHADIPKGKRVRRRKIARKNMKKAIARKEHEDLLAEKEADIKGMEARLAELMLQQRKC